MRKPSEIRIALGLIFAEALTVEQMESFHLLATDVSRTFHARSSCFWQSVNERAEAFAEVFKAALYEAYRQLSDFIILAESPKAVSSGLLKELIQRAEGDCLQAITVSVNSNNLLLLMRPEAAQRTAAAMDLKEWSGLNMNGLLAALQRCKTAVSKIPLSDLPETTAIAPDGYCLPTNVHFAPVARIPAGGITPAEAIARICSALQAVGRIGTGMRLAIYGAGTIAEALFPLLKDNLVAIVDGNQSKQGSSFHHLVIEPPEALARRDAEFDAVFITPIGPEKAIRSALRGILGEKFDKKIILSSDASTETAGSDLPTVQATPAPADGNLAGVRLISEDQVPDRPQKTKVRELTKRGVLYVGYPCNIKCVFCYYAYTQSKKWHSIQECKSDADLYRLEYGNEWVDITGGEPTIYPGIFELLDHCRRVDLKTSIITNTIALADIDKVKKFQDHGLYDFLCSIHALTENYDLITARRGAWKKLEQAVTNFGRLGMRWRTNCTMTALNMRQMKRIAEFSFENGSRVINFISYNPFYEWSQKMDIDFQARHSEIVPYLLETLEYCDRVGLEANVRYFPLCLMKGHEEKAYNYPQLSYDPHEWDYCSWFSDKTRNPSSKMPRVLYSIADNEEQLHMYLARITQFVGFDQNDTCKHCAGGLICDGFTNQYTRRFGIGEMEPYGGKLITDPTFYIRQQEKVIDKLAIDYEERHSDCVLFPRYSAYGGAP